MDGLIITTRRLSSKTVAGTGTPDSDSVESILPLPNHHIVKTTEVRVIDAQPDDYARREGTGWSVGGEPGVPEWRIEDRVWLWLPSWSQETGGGLPEQ